MLTYKEMKDVLKADPNPIKMKYFTRNFYDAYCESRLTGDWEPVYATDFYNRDGSGYCVFQELFHASLPRWRLTFSKMDAGYPVDIARRYISADTEEEAKSYGLSWLEEFGADFVEVMRVAGY